MKVVFSENELKALQYVKEEEERQMQIDFIADNIRELYKELKELGGDLQVMTDRGFYWQNITKVLEHRQETPTQYHGDYFLRVVYNKKNFNI